VSREAIVVFVVETDAADVENQFGAFKRFFSPLRDSTPEYIPQIAMAFVDDVFSIDVVANGQPRASIAARALFVIQDARS